MGKGFDHFPPHIRPGWEIDYEHAASYGDAQGRLSALGAELGFPKLGKLHSFRNWAPAFARQLPFRREVREVPIHWATVRKCQADAIRRSAPPSWN